jgi:hypothetical protein
MLYFFKFEVITRLTAARQDRNSELLIDLVNSINLINPKTYKKRFIFFLIYVIISIKLQNERCIIC